MIILSQIPKIFLEKIRNLEGSKPIPRKDIGLGFFFQDWPIDHMVFLKDVLIYESAKCTLVIYCCMCH